MQSYTSFEIRNLSIGVDKGTSSPSGTRISDTTPSNRDFNSVLPHKAGEIGHRLDLDPLHRLPDKGCIAVKGQDDAQPVFSEPAVAKERRAEVANSDERCLCRRNIFSR